MHIPKIHFPRSNDVFLAFGMAIFLISAWEIRAFFYKIPSFLLYMNVGQIAAVFAYMMAFAFIESLLVLCLTFVPAIILPGSWFNNDFATKASSAILVAAVSSVLYQNYLPSTYPGTVTISLWLFFTLLSMCLVVLLIHFVKPVAKGFAFFLEQLSIMVYIFAPIGIISIFVVLFRNLF